MSSDPYPTRIDEPGRVLQRQEPVIHGSVSELEASLSNEHIAAYERNGYIVIPDFFAPEEVESLRAEADHLRVSEEVRQSELAVTEPTSGESRWIYAAHTVNERMAALSVDARILDIVRVILGGEVYLHQTRVNYRPPFRGQDFFWHSDFETWHAEDGMPTMRAVSASIALTENHEWNGPMLAIPGSHKHFCQCVSQSPHSSLQQSLSKQDDGIPSDEQLVWLAEQGGIVSEPAPLGSLILFDCNLMHGSNSNITPHPGSKIYFVYNSIDNTLRAPYAAEHERPWYLSNRKPEVLQAESMEETAG